LGCATIDPICIAVPAAKPNGRTMEKRYQIFISSTFRDLVAERQAVLRAILELDHIPAGMELFPAGDENAWQLIKDVINESDYYILIIGGRYGSMDESGIGYTEKEYEYATSMKIPIIPLLHENPNNLPRGKTETDETAWQKLQEFRAKAEKKHTCVYWNGADDLKAKVITGLIAAVKRHPGIGWMRADQIIDAAEALKLRKQISELETKLKEIANQAPEGSSDLAQGNDLLELTYRYREYKAPESEFELMKPIASYEDKIVLTWNEIFSYLAPELIDEIDDKEFDEKVNAFMEKKHDEGGVFGPPNGHSLGNFRLDTKDLQTIKIQLRALGLITKGSKKRSAKDTKLYWTLTPYGDNVMTVLRAVIKPGSAA